MLHTEIKILTRSVPLVMLLMTNLLLKCVMVFTKCFFKHSVALCVNEWFNVKIWLNQWCTFLGGINC